MKFLAVTDLHYSDEPQGNSDRAHVLSAEKLRTITENFSDGCDFIVDLGDTADSFSGGRSQKELFSEVCSILEKTGLPFYSIIGNHDTSTDKREICSLMKMPGRYYAFDGGGYRCLVLDACMNDVNVPYPESEIVWDNCYIDEKQKNWLRDELQKSSLPVFIFTHVPFMLEEYEIQNPHLIVNRDEILDIIVKSGKVKAVFSGHYHNGCHTIYNGIPFVVFSALALEKDITFAVVTAEDGKLSVSGHGRNASASFDLNM
ncbi:MAG: metallophosphoesterase [Clostridiales bacterium]|nr:metallophosphoesterase [Clostridiales bacterium]